MNRHAISRGPNYWDSAVAEVIAGREITHSQGYKMLYVPMHPEAHRGYVYEHRLLASVRLGRPLVTDEHVHHINEDKTDNRLENLMVVPMSVHRRGHCRSGLSDSDVKAMIREGAGYADLTALRVGSHRVRRLRRELGMSNRPAYKQTVPDSTMPSGTV